MSKNRSIEYSGDIIFYDDDQSDEMVDISSGNAERADISKPKRSGKKPVRPKKDGGKTKKIAIITAVAAAVLVAVGVAAFCLLSNGEGGILAPEEKEYTFPDTTVVSGISLSGKTVDEAKALLESKSDSFAKPFSVTIRANGKNTTLTEKDFEYTYDIDEVLAQVKRDEENPPSQSTEGSSEAKVYEITATYTAESVEKNARAVAESTDKDAVNARVSKFTPYSDNRFEYAEAEEGYKLDSDDLTAQLTSFMNSGEQNGELEAKVETLEADIQVDDIKQNVKKLASYKTVSYNTANGTSNMKVSLEACNGSVIEPGATWSFNECTGDSNLESNGYKSAHVISEGKLVDGIGGGICQSSSTIYNAAVRANMDVEERSNHKWASSYVPTGLDATIDYPRLDLKLSNPTDYQMFMECKLEGTTLYVSIWGAKSSSYDTIKTHNELVTKDGDSYTVKAWRIYYKDGEEVDRESLGSSTYDNDNGYIFINADNDTNDEVDETKATEPATKKAESSSKTQSSKSSSKPSSSSQSSKAQSSSKVTSSSSSQQSTTVKPTQKPTQKPTEKPADSSVTEPPATQQSEEQTTEAEE